MMLLTFMTLILNYVLFYQIPHFRRSGQLEADTLRDLSVIIPARNEENNIYRLLASLQPYLDKVKEIIVVDDHSTDRTAEIAKSYGATVISLKELPKGWFGKSFGCWNGASASRGKILLFLDADTTVEENGLERLVACIKAHGGMISVHPFHKMKRPYETLSAFFHLVIMGALGAFLPFKKAQGVNGAFGQCALISRSDYFKFGGHQAIQGELMENMAFGALIARRGGSVRAYSGKGAISMRMYPEGLSSLVKGWSKSFASGAVRTDFRYLLLVSIWLGGLVTFLVKTQELPLPWSLFIYGILCCQLWRVLRNIGDFKWYMVLGFPIWLVFFITVFGYSCFRTFFTKNIVWKDRKMDL
ncbi:glycosyltransferase [Bacillus tianshenii]|uniref:glycosyltransferase n=1 Tax=Sutcliffiella tianshenii TaxID=1463404 RepID=UPI001CD630FE|nr:glycosyltransferase family 2 protein [Bacillus tianshenii]MCA1320838.1 glycosyltransferase [Bacillus tianshenii]